MPRRKKKESRGDSNPNPLREQLRAMARNRRQEMIDRQPEIKSYLEKDPGYPARSREHDRQMISVQLEELRMLLELAEPLVRKIKGAVPNITDESVETACYLLFSHSLQSFDAILNLAIFGFNHQIVELLRGIRETLDLAILFMLEGPEGSSVQEWFSGEIISNAAAREVFDAW